jgi:hypothetical protein
VGTTAALADLYLGTTSGASGTYSLSGSGSLKVFGNEHVGDSGTGSFNQSGGSHTVSGALTLASSPGGSGTYALSAGKVTAASTVINSNGSFQFNGGNASLGNLSLAGTGRLVIGSGSGKTLVASSLSVAAGATLDLNDDAMIINYTGASPVATIRQYLIKGRGTTAAPATWNGLGGIMSSKASPASQGLGGTNNDGQSLALGYAENSAISQPGSYSTFMGQTVGSSSILIKFTRGADANLDGVVDNNDATIVGAEFGAAGSGHWYLGDFDYSGQCDNADATVLGALFNPSAPPLSPNQLSAQFGAAFASAFEAGQLDAAAIPEPSTIGLLALCGITLCRRSRRA